MDSRLVIGVIIDAFDDIDFTTCGPVRTVCPEGWPSSATSWHVYRVHDEQPAIEGALRRDANTLTSTRDLRGRFYAHDRVACTIDLDEVV